MTGGENGEEIGGKLRSRRGGGNNSGQTNNELNTLLTLTVYRLFLLNMSLDIKSSHSQLGGLLIHSSAALLAGLEADAASIARIDTLVCIEMFPSRPLVCPAQRQAAPPPTGASEGKQLGLRTRSVSRVT